MLFYVHYCFIGLKRLDNNWEWFEIDRINTLKINLFIEQLIINIISCS